MLEHHISGTLGAGDSSVLFELDQLCKMISIPLEFVSKKSLALTG